jgi:hypothetical protein
VRIEGQAAVQHGVIAPYQGEATSAITLPERAIDLCHEFPSLYVQALVTFS